MVVVEAKPRLSARQTSELGPRLAEAVRQAGAAGGLVVARFLNQLAQDRLRSAGLSYLDFTGNAWISLERPGLLIATQGATKDPSPPRRGVRQGLLRRSSRDYDVAKTNLAVPFLAPRGLPDFTNRLRQYDGRYALTGSLAVPTAPSVAPGRLASCYVQDPERDAEQLDLRPVEVGANVLLLEPFDPVVFERSRQESALTLLAVTQCAVHLLTGTGREPAEAESLLSWMAENEDAWRA